MTQGVTGLLLTNSPLEVGLFQARLDYVSTTQVKLNGKGGNYIEVQGVLMDLAASSVDYTLTTTDNRIDSTGADAAAALTTSTLYYLYASNNKASYAPGRLRASTVAPTTIAGVKYLGTSGNALNWRFVGWARTNGSTQFVDSDTQRFVVSYYNRKSARLFSCPAYNDNNASTSYTTTATSLAAANGGTGSKIEFIANGEDSVTVTQTINTAPDLVDRFCYGGLGIDSTTTITVGGVHQSYGTGKSECFNSDYHFVPAEGYRHLNILLCTNSGTLTVQADMSRLGGSSDGATTYISAEVMI